MANVRNVTWGNHSNNDKYFFTYIGIFLDLPNTWQFNASLPNYSAVKSHAIMRVYGKDLIYKPIFVQLNITSIMDRVICRCLHRIVIRACGEEVI